MTTPTQAQIEAAAKAMQGMNALLMLKDIPYHDIDPNEQQHWCDLAQAALTAAAEAGEQGGYGLKKGDPRLDEIVGGPRKAKLDRATIERCAERAKAKAKELGWAEWTGDIIAADIRAMKDKP